MVGMQVVTSLLNFNMGILIVKDTIRCMVFLIHPPTSPTIATSNDRI